MIVSDEKKKDEPTVEDLDKSSIGTDETKSIADRADKSKVKDLVERAKGKK